MNKQKLEEEFDKRFECFDKILYKAGKDVYLGRTATDKDIKSFISQNYIPKAEVEKLIIEYLRSGSVKNCYNEEAIENLIERIKL